MLRIVDTRVGRFEHDSFERLANSIVDILIGTFRVDSSADNACQVFVAALFADKEFRVDGLAKAAGNLVWCRHFDILG